MAHPGLYKSWMYVQSKLRLARTLLDDSSPKSELQSFEEYLDHNELELAMDELDWIGQQCDCPGGFWRNLERAANAMKLTERAKEFRQRFQDAI